MLQELDGPFLADSPTPTAAFRDRVELMGVAVDRVAFDDVLDRVESCVAAGTPRRFVTVNLDYLRLASRDAGFRETLNTADLAVPDGMPLVWAATLAGSLLPQRVAGLDLFQAICERAAVRGWSVFLLGAAPGVAEKAAAALTRRYAGLRVAGAYSPPIGDFDAGEEVRIRGLIRQARPDVLFVALGAPRQDVWISESIEHLRVPLSIGVGCAFDIACGGAKRAPRWMQRGGLEWAFRLSREPGRLWRRYLLDDAPTFFALVYSSLRSRRRQTRRFEVESRARAYCLLKSSPRHNPAGPAVPTSLHDQAQGGPS